MAYRRKTSSSGYSSYSRYGRDDDDDDDDDVSLQQKLTQVASEYEMKKKLEVGKLKNRILALTNEKSRMDTQRRAEDRRHRQELQEAEDARDRFERQAMEGKLEISTLTRAKDESEETGKELRMELAGARFELADFRMNLAIEKKVSSHYKSKLKECSDAQIEAAARNPAAKKLAKRKAQALAGIAMPINYVQVQIDPEETMEPEPEDFVDIVASLRAAHQVQMQQQEHEVLSLQSKIKGLQSLCSAFKTKLEEARKPRAMEAADDDEFQDAPAASDAEMMDVVQTDDDGKEAGAVEAEADDATAASTEINFIGKKKEKEGVFVFGQGGANKKKDGGESSDLSSSSDDGDSGQVNVFNKKAAAALNAKEDDEGDAIRARMNELYVRELYDKLMKQEKDRSKTSLGMWSVGLDSASGAGGGEAEQQERILVQERILEWENEWEEQWACEQKEELRQRREEQWGQQLQRLNGEASEIGAMVREAQSYRTDFISQKKFMKAAIEGQYTLVLSTLQPPRNTFKFSAMMQALVGSALCKATSNKQLRVMNALLELGADANATIDAQFGSGGGGAMASPRSPKGKELGAAVEDMERLHRTPLHIAAETGWTDGAKALVGAGADVDALDGAGQTALHISAEGNHNRLAAYLMRIGVDMELRDNDDKTPAQLAEAKGATWKKTTRVLADPSSLFWNKSHHATMHYKAGRYEEACKYYSTALELVKDTRPQPSANNQATLRFNHARAALQCSKLVMAVEQLTKVLELRPDYKKALAARAECHLKLFNYSEAKSDYDALIEQYGSADEDDSDAEDVDDEEVQEWRRRLVEIATVRRKSHREWLEVGRDASASEIKKAYRRQSLKWHPDRNSSTPEGLVQATNIFKFINEANNALSRN